MALLSNIITPTNVLTDSDIGISVQAYDANILTSSDIGSTVQAYDADTVKTDVSNTFTANQIIYSGSLATSLTVKSDGSGNYAGGQLSLIAGQTAAGNEFGSVLMSMDRGTLGNALLTIQRRDRSNAYKGVLWQYDDTDGMRFFTATGLTDTGTAERMRITSSGGVSFGSSGTAYGTSGQVLTSNGNGVPTWETPSSGVTTGKAIAMAIVFG